jgi:retron-type reverse transcriptase
MASTVNGLWDSFIEFENFYRGYVAAARGRRYREEILAFRLNLEENLFTLVQDLTTGTYWPSPMRQFRVRSPKPRLISAPAFRDRVVQHALIRVIEPHFERRFIDGSFACRKGRGTHAAIKDVFKSTRIARRNWKKYYVLKGDVSDFYASVNHAILKRLIRRTIRDKKVLRFLDTIIIDTYSTEGKEGAGIPIGTLTSQLLANVYLDPLDHFIKEGNRIKHYARYMDDFVIIHHDKQYLRELLGEIDAFLHDLALKLNPKTAIFPGKQGIDFCGYRVWPTHIKPRKSTVKRAKKRIKKFSEVYKENPRILEHAKRSITSFLGYIKHCSGLKTAQSTLKKAVFKPGMGKKPALPDG